MAGNGLIRYARFRAYAPRWQELPGKSGGDRHEHRVTLRCGPSCRNLVRRSRESVFKPHRLSLNPGVSEPRWSFTHDWSARHYRVTAFAFSLAIVRAVGL